MEACISSIQREPDLDVVLEPFLEASKHDLALTRLQAVHHGRNRPLKISTREQDQLLQFPKRTLQICSASIVFWYKTQVELALKEEAPGFLSAK